MRSQVQASEMRFLRRIAGVILFNKVRSSGIRESLNIEPLLLRIARSQLRWFGHASRMLQERLPKQALLAKANGRQNEKQKNLPKQMRSKLPNHSVTNGLPPSQHFFERQGGCVAAGPMTWRWASQT